MQANPAPFSRGAAVSDVRLKPLHRHRLGMDTVPWPVWFVWYAICCQIALLFVGDTPLRLPLRIAAFGGSLLLLYLLPPRYPAHPALKLLKWVPVVLAVGLVHPQRDNLLACVGQILLYVAIFAPVAWVAGGKPDTSVLQHVIVALWLFYLASAVTGVLQVYYPGHFQGAISSIISSRATFQEGDATVVLADGTRILRPFGLSDIPGGAATGGLNAIILGAGILVTTRKVLIRAVAGAGMLAGLFAIFLSQVRVELVMAGVCAVVLFAMLVRMAEWKRIFVVGTVVGSAALAGATWAFAVGGEQTINRFNSLTSENPFVVYSNNRGFFLEGMITHDLMAYPFGGGLGRWGMMNYYFGHPETQLYSEIMWTSWLYDGGIPLVIIYMLAFGTAIWLSWRLAIHRHDDLGLWSGVIFAYNVAALSGTFVFPLFALQSGLETWLINACLFSAALAVASAAPQQEILNPAHV
jgi:hypothetical protein